MTQITSPDGTVVTGGERTAAPFGVSVHAGIHGVSAAHVQITGSGGLVLGFADAQIHAAGDTPADRLAEMVAIGQAITAQAEKALGELPAPEPVPADERLDAEAMAVTV